MSSGDFLRKEARTPLTEHYVMAGALGVISTNSSAILTAARATFCPVEGLVPKPRLHLRFWVDPKGTTQPPWPKPFFRGLNHLIFCGFSNQDSILINLRTRLAIGRISPAMGADCAYWKTVILPVLISILSASVGVLELHCACVTKDGNALLLAGDSGSGKSTLALALARAGFGYVSDDRTYCSGQDGGLVAWGLPTLLKLRPAGALWFPELQGLDPVIAPNGERAFLIDPDRWPGITRVKRCNPQGLVFLDRREGEAFDLTPMPGAEAASRLEEGLIAEAPEAVEAQRDMLANLVMLPCWRLRYGERPQSVAERLDRCWVGDRPRTFFRGHDQRSVECHRMEIRAERQDPLRRFTLTPFVADLQLMGRPVRLETNRSAILSRALRVLARYQGATGRRPEFLWRIIGEPRVQMKPPWPERTAFSDESLRYINIGQKNFIAIDLDARLAAAFLAEGLAEDEPGFCSPFLGDLFYLTAGRLGLVPVSAACVAAGERGILIFGAPNSGKTTSGYLAGKLGLEFLADQAVFLEMEAAKLHAWGDFLPAAFRPETVQFLPELEAMTRTFRYRDLTFLYLEKQASNTPTPARPVVPVGCVFLERKRTSVPNLLPMGCAEFRARLKESLPFRDDQKFAPRRAEVLRALEEVPAYTLAYGSDPAATLDSYQDLLMGCGLEVAKR
jgi:DNA polymerase III delta prime subunit